MNCSTSEQQWGRLLLLVLTVVVALSLVPAATATQEGDPGDSSENATEISSGTSVSGTIPGDSDEDWYAIEVERGETINLTAAVSRDGNLKFDIVDPSGESIASTRGGEGDGTFYTGVTARQSATYYVRVYYWFGDDPADYSITVDTYATTDREPNEDRNNATGISTGEQIQDEIAAGDTDWYAFDAQRGQTINVTATIGSSGGVEFDLKTPGGNTIGGPRGQGETVVGGATAPESGTYYIQAYKFSGNTGADYSFTVETYATTDNEPNESPPNATQLSLNASTEDTLSTGDTDWYVFDLERGDSINVSGTVTGAGGLDFRLKYENRSNFGGQGNVGSGRYAFNATAPYTGTYYLLVSQSSAPGPDYSLSVQSAGAGEVEPSGDDTDRDASEGAADDQNGETAEQQGGGLPLLPIALAVALVVVLLAVVLWRRDSEDQ